MQLCLGTAHLIPQSWALLKGRDYHHLKAVELHGERCARGVGVLHNHHNVGFCLKTETTKC